MLVNSELEIDYTNLYDQLGNKNKHSFNSYEYHKMID